MQVHASNKMKLVAVATIICVYLIHVETFTSDELTGRFFVVQWISLFVLLSGFPTIPKRAQILERLLQTVACSTPTTAPSPQARLSIRGGPLNMSGSRLVSAFLFDNPPGPRHPPKKSNTAGHKTNTPQVIQSGHMSSFGQWLADGPGPCAYFNYKPLGLWGSLVEMFGPWLHNNAGLFLGTSPETFPTTQGFFPGISLENYGSTRLRQT